MTRTRTSPVTGKAYELCGWRGCACNLPRSSSHFCRWHEYCAKTNTKAHDFAAFDSWLAKMQHAYPSQGVWSWKVERLWPIVTGRKEAT